ncbi:hypothetical protein chiPu_0025608 [Chiloscyllium punctatum]|uniref:Uncharacterized protein n=1 Tax=Chiloscyllium punctatum TaxID=137246 RepID=A0A401TGS6_CHIPU|nr:hypothetical protein [Chiloscyllium punctatum]
MGLHFPACIAPGLGWNRRTTTPGVPRSGPPEIARNAPRKPEEGTRKFAFSTSPPPKKETGTNLHVGDMFLYYYLDSNGQRVYTLKVRA